MYLPVVLALAFSAVSTQAADDIWMPVPKTSWQWQLNGKIDTTVDVEMYDIDLFDTSKEVVASLKDQGRKVVCYFSAGSWEDWRPDADKFPAGVKGRPMDGWPGERWLDIRNLEILGPILEARLDMCKEKGFDGVEPDNVDGYTNRTGFSLHGEDQLRFNRFIADAAHARGLSVGLKNDLDQVEDLVSTFDWALNEQCFEFEECGTLQPFVDAGKAVFHVEYKLRTDQFCTEANRLNFNSMRKKLDLDASREPCR